MIDSEESETLSPFQIFFVELKEAKMEGVNKIRSKFGQEL